MFVYKLWPCEKLSKNDSNKFSNSILKAICTCSTILSYKTGLFSRNIFLLVRMQKVNLWQIVHKWFKKLFKFNIKGYIWTFYHSKLWNRCIQSQPLFACSYGKCELMKNSAQMIQIRSQILHLSLFIYVLPFKALT